MEQGESEKVRLERELVKFKAAKRSRSPNLETAMLQVCVYIHTKHTLWYYYIRKEQGFEINNSHCKRQRE